MPLQVPQAMHRRVVAEEVGVSGTQGLLRIYPYLLTCILAEGSMALVFWSCSILREVYARLLLLRLRYHECCSFCELVFLAFLVAILSMTMYTSLDIIRTLDLDDWVRLIPMLPTYSWIGLIISPISAAVVSPRNFSSTLRLLSAILTLLIYLCVVHERQTVFSSCLIYQ